LADNLVNGIGKGLPSGVQLYANLLSEDGKTVLGSVPVNPNGTYSFNVGQKTNYKIQISTIQGTAGSATAPATALPSGWFNTGEKLGTTTGHDGTINGILNVAVSTSNISNANFGIKYIDPDYDMGIAYNDIGGTAIEDVTDNDSINGKPVTLGTGGNAKISVVGTWPSGITLDTLTGKISVSIGTTPGRYAVTYKLCDTLKPTPNCVDQVDSVIVLTCVDNPAADCDGDGVPNKYETFYGTSKTDSCSFNLTGQLLKPSAAWNIADCDGDGIPNAQEKINKTDPLDKCSPGVTTVPNISGTTNYTGTATYVANEIDLSSTTPDGGDFTVTYKLSSTTTGTNPNTVGSSYPASFTQKFNLTDLIPTDAIANPKPNFTYNIRIDSGTIVGGIKKRVLKLDITNPANTKLVKNINWDNTSLPSFPNSTNNALKAIYNNDVYGTLGVGPLTTPAYTANTSTTIPLNGNLVTSLQYALLSGIQSPMPSYFSYITTQKWRNYNSGSSNDGVPLVHTFKKTWSFDDSIQSVVFHNDYEVSTTEIVIAAKNAPYDVSLQYAVTNDHDALNQIISFNKSILTITKLCTQSTVNLNSYVTNSAPINSKILWYTNPNHSGTSYSTPNAAVSGTYYAFFYDTLKNCYSKASAEIKINPCTPVIDPDYEMGTVSSATGGTPISDVTDNDSINGQAAVLGTGGNATIAQVGTWPSGISLNTTTGAVTVTAGTPPGKYAVVYKLCDTLKPTPNCVDQLDTVIVTPFIDPDYEMGTVSSATGGTPISDVTDNDTVNGQPAVLGTGGNATIAQVGTWPSGISLNTNNWRSNGNCWNASRQICCSGINYAIL
jgi:hypothetical protein